jgi:hypothetical protein
MLEFVQRIDWPVITTVIAMNWWYIAAKIAAAAATFTAVFWGIFRFFARNRSGRMPAQELALMPGRENRTAFKIAIIDDEADKRFTNRERESLRRRGFDITYLKDVRQIHELAEFHIVLCDIVGVGRLVAVGDNFHGGIIASELRKLHPLVFIILYSSMAFNPSFNKFYALADDAVDLPKLGGESLIEVFDNAIGVLRSPSAQWMRFKKYVIGNREQSMDPKSLSKLHEQFLRRFAAVFSADKRLALYSFENGEGRSNIGLDIARDATDAVEKLIDLIQ